MIITWTTTLKKFWCIYILRLQELDREWSKCEQMTFLKWLILFINLVEQRFYYVGTLTVIIFEIDRCSRLYSTRLYK